AARRGAGASAPSPEREDRRRGAEQQRPGERRGQQVGDFRKGEEHARSGITLGGAGAWPRKRESARHLEMPSWLDIKTSRLDKLVGMAERLETSLRRARAFRGLSQA